jgi:outer membrane protein
MLVLAIPPIPNLTANPAQDLQVALTQRPDYQAARLGITIDKANEASARNSLLPQVNLVASYGYNGQDRNFAASRHMVATEDFPSSSIGFNVSIPLTNAVGRGQARGARLRREQAEADLKRLEADIAVNVANAASQIETARQRVVADRAAYDLANQALADEVKKLRAGSSSTLAVIQAQQILIGVENSVASALAAQRQAAANYDQALGTTLPHNNITLADNK